MLCTQCDKEDEYMLCAQCDKEDEYMLCTQCDKKDEYMLRTQCDKEDGYMLLTQGDEEDDDQMMGPNSQPALGRRCVDDRLIPVLGVWSGLGLGLGAGVAHGTLEISGVHGNVRRANADAHRTATPDAHTQQTYTVTPKIQLNPKFDDSVPGYTVGKAKGSD
jgi:hypothetical protein